MNIQFSFPEGASFCFDRVRQRVRPGTSEEKQRGHRKATGSGRNIQQTLPFSNPSFKHRVSVSDCKETFSSALLCGITTDRA